MDNKMTDDEIKKALECCCKITNCEENCDRINDCILLHLHEVIDLINRNDTKIVELTEENNRQQAEIERLEKILDTRCDKCPAAITAITEFAAKVKDIFSPEDEVRQDIDSIAQEMARWYRK